MPTKYASKPPPGVVPDYVNPPRSTGVIRLEVVAPILMAIATFFVALRLYVRRFIVQNMGWDDVTIAVSLLLTAATVGCALRTTHFGLGRHLYELPLHEFSPGFLKWELALQEVYTAASLAVRLAIVLLILRIVYPIKRYRMFIYAMAFIITAYHVAKAFAFLFGCVPIALNWNITIKTGHCIDRFKLAVAFNALNVITDVLLWTIPIPVVWKLQMHTRHKIEVLSVFAVGLIIIAISIYRCVIQNTLVGITDVTWAYPDVHLWACIELEVGIICGCMPPLKVLSSHLLPSSWFSNASHEPHRLSQLGNPHRKGFSHLGGQDSRATNATLVNGNTAASNGNGKVPEWYDVEAGVPADTGIFNNSMPAVKNTVVSMPPNERTYSALERELDERGVAGSERETIPAIHRQQAFEVTHEAKTEV